jgi:hypothetical protein
VISDPEAAEVHPEAPAGDAALHGKQHIIPLWRQHCIPWCERHDGEPLTHHCLHWRRRPQPQHALPLRVRVRRERRTHQIHLKLPLPLPHRKHHFKPRPVLNRHRRHPEDRRPAPIITAIIRPNPNLVIVCLNLHRPHFLIQQG